MYKNKKFLRDLLFFLLMGLLGYISFFVYQKTTLFQTEDSDFLKVNTKLPEFYGFKSGNEIVKSFDVLSVTKPTILYVYTTSCGSCLADLVKWNKINKQKTLTYNSVGLAYGAEHTDLYSLLKRGNIVFKNIIIDDTTVEKLKVKKWPTIIIVDMDRTIKFLSFGENATDKLIKVLDK